jgi:hypothetical protein
MSYKFKGKKDCKQSSGNKGKYLTIKKDGSRRCYKSEKQYKSSMAWGHGEADIIDDEEEILQEIENLVIDEASRDSSGHLKQYKAPEGSDRDKKLDQTKKDLKKAKALRKKGKSKDAEDLEQRAYNRRNRMEKQHRDKNESLLREMVRRLLIEKLSKATEDKIRKKAKDRGYTFGSMKAEYKKGLAAFASSGSRPGMTAHGWAMARINKCTVSQKWSGCKKSKAKKK